MSRRVAAAQARLRAAATLLRHARDLEPGDDTTRHDLTILATDCNDIARALERLQSELARHLAAARRARDASRRVA